MWATARLPWTGRIDHRGPGGVAVQAGPLVDLQLEQLEHLAGLVGGCEKLQSTPVVGEHQTDCVGATDDGRVFGERVQEVDGIESGDQRVGHFNEQLRESFYGDHGCVSILRSPRLVPISRSCRR